MNLKTLIAKVLKEEPENISDSSGTTTLKSWSSRKHVELVMEIENTYNVQFTTPEIVGLRSLQEIAEALKVRGVVFD